MTRMILTKVNKFLAIFSTEPTVNSLRDLISEVNLRTISPVLLEPRVDKERVWR